MGFVWVVKGDLFLLGLGMCFVDFVNDWMKYGWIV